MENTFRNKFLSQKRNLFILLTNIYNNEKALYEIIPLRNSNIKRAVIFSGKLTKNMAYPPNMLGRTCVYLETDEVLNKNNYYKNVQRLLNLIWLATDLPIDYEAEEIGGYVDFESIYNDYKHEPFYNPNIIQGCPITQNPIARVASYSFLINKHNDEDFVKFDNALTTYIWAQELTRLPDFHLKYTLFMTLYLSSVDQLSGNSQPRCVSNFITNEFILPLTIEKLCKLIYNDNYNISLNATINTLDWLNELLEIPNFYDILYAKKTNMDFSKNIADLVSTTKDYRNKSFSNLNSGEQNNIKRLNRLLLKETYPQETPNNPIKESVPHLICEKCGAKTGNTHSTSRTYEIEKLIRDLMTGNLDEIIKKVKNRYSELRSRFLHAGFLSAGEKEGGFLFSISSEKEKELIEDMINIAWLNRKLLELFLCKRQIS